MPEAQTAPQVISPVNFKGNYADLNKAHFGFDKKAEDLLYPLGQVQRDNVAAYKDLVKKVKSFSELDNLSADLKENGEDRGVDWYDKRNIKKMMNEARGHIDLSEKIKSDDPLNRRQAAVAASFWISDHDYKDWTPWDHELLDVVEKRIIAGDPDVTEATLAALSNASSERNPKHPGAKIAHEVYVDAITHPKKETDRVLDPLHMLREDAIKQAASQITVEYGDGEDVLKQRQNDLLVAIKDRVLAGDTSVTEEVVKALPYVAENHPEYPGASIAHELFLNEIVNPSKPEESRPLSSAFALLRHTAIKQAATEMRSRYGESEGVSAFRQSELLEAVEKRIIAGDPDVTGETSKLFDYVMSHPTYPGGRMYAKLIRGVNEGKMDIPFIKAKISGSSGDDLIRAAYSVL